MKIGIKALYMLAATTASTTIAFAPNALNTHPSSAATTLNLQANNDNGTKIKSFPDQVKGIVASTVIAAALWASPPPALFDNMNMDAATNANNQFMNAIQTSMVADAKEMASGSGSRVNKDPESLLRLGLPIPKDKEVSM